MECCNKKENFSNNEDVRKGNVKDTKYIKYLGPNETKCPFCGGKLIWEDDKLRQHCENCGSEVVDMIRTTGYISYQERMTPGKVNEISQRVSHDSGNNAKNHYKGVFHGK